MKKIALCSPVAGFTTAVASELMSSKGIWYISFKDVIEEWLESGGKVVRKRQRPLGFILPSLKFLKKNYDDLGVIVFGADTIVHLGAVTEIKKEYQLVYLANGKSEDKEIAEQMLSEEYSQHLEKVADVKIDCARIKNAVEKIYNILEEK